MAEFIFDLQRFADDTEDTTDTTETTDTTDEVVGDGDGDGGGEGSSGDSSSSAGGTNVYLKGTDENDPRTAGGLAISDTNYTLKGQTGKYITGGSGWEPRIRNEGEIFFSMFMDSTTANAFADYSYDIFRTALENNDVPYYDIQDGIANSVDYSRLLGSALISTTLMTQSISSIRTSAISSSTGVKIRRRSQSFSTLVQF